MCSEIGVGKLSETQKSKLRNGHPVRIIIGSGNNLHLTDPQIKKLQSAHKKGAAYTINRVKSTVHGGIDKLSNKAKEKLEEIIQPIEGEGVVKPKRGRPKKGAGVIGDVLKGLINVTGMGVGEGMSMNAEKASILSSIKRIKKARKKSSKKSRKGKGVIGDVLKNLIGSTGLGVVKPKRGRKGKGVMTDLFKSGNISIKR
jgi:hypothetical protein